MTVVHTLHDVDLTRRAVDSGLKIARHTQVLMQWFTPPM